MGLIATKCVQCGANIQVDYNARTGICPYCNTPYIIENATRTEVKMVINNIQNTYVNNNKKNNEAPYVDASYLQNYPKLYQQKANQIMSALKSMARTNASNEKHFVQWDSGKELGFHECTTDLNQMKEALEKKGIKFTKHDTFKYYDYSKDFYASYIQEQFINNDEMADNVVRILRERLAKDGFKNIQIKVFHGKTHIEVEDDRNTYGFWRKVLFGETNVYDFENETVGLDVHFEW